MKATKKKNSETFKSDLKEDSNLKKLEINHLKELIQSKLTESENAKKAALILNDWINKK